MLTNKLTIIIISTFILLLTNGCSTIETLSNNNKQIEIQRKLYELQQTQALANAQVQISNNEAVSRQHEANTQVLIDNNRQQTITTGILLLPYLVILLFIGLITYRIAPILVNNYTHTPKQRDWKLLNDIPPQLYNIANNRYGDKFDIVLANRDTYGYNVVYKMIDGDIQFAIENNKEIKLLP